MKMSTFVEREKSFFELFMGNIFRQFVNDGKNANFLDYLSPVHLDTESRTLIYRVVWER